MTTYTPPAEAVEAAAAAIERDLRARTAPPDRFSGQGGLGLTCEQIATAALTAAGPIIAAEVERLDEALAREVRGRNYAMRQRDDWQRAARGNIDALNTAIRERDEARQQVADLRAGIEALAAEGEEWGRGGALDLSKRLRALLAGSGEQPGDPTPDAPLWGYRAAQHPAPVVPENPHGMWCPPGCGHDRSEAVSESAEPHRHTSGLCYAPHVAGRAAHIESATGGA